MAVLHLQALQCLVNILRSLVEWYTRSVTDAVPADSHRPVPEGNVSSSADVKESWNDLTSTPERILPNGDAVHPDPGQGHSPHVKYYHHWYCLLLTVHAWPVHGDESALLHLVEFLVSSLI